LPVISGGDRHGHQPNAVLNLTDASTFSEFVLEIRDDKVSRVLVMPEYWEDLKTRKLEILADFFHTYPDYPPRSAAMDRSRLYSSGGWPSAVPGRILGYDRSRVGEIGHVVCLSCQDRNDAAGFANGLCTKS
jgi:hypothetical protein